MIIAKMFEKSNMAPSIPPSFLSHVGVNNFVGFYRVPCARFFNASIVSFGSAPAILPALFDSIFFRGVTMFTHLLSKLIFETRLSELLLLIERRGYWLVIRSGRLKLEEMPADL
jgi:hypothetical protein